MSYVIQNLHFNSILNTRTPRFKFYFFYLNLNRILFFFNQTLWIFYFKLQPSSFNSNVFFFHKFFFSRQFKKVIKKVNFKFVGFYDNRLVRSLAFWIFTLSILNLNLINIFQKMKYFAFVEKKCPIRSSNLISNQYILSFPILNVRFFQQHYKNFFFFIMLFNIHQWLDFNNFFQFYYNFIIVNNYMTLFYPFYSNYFLNVYNF